MSAEETAAFKQGGAAYRRYLNSLPENEFGGRGGPRGSGSRAARGRPAFQRRPRVGRVSHKPLGGPTPEHLQPMYHYTNEAGYNGIMESSSLRPSRWTVEAGDARYGDGQYLTDLEPGPRALEQLSDTFVNHPRYADKFTHCVRIDARGLEVLRGREHVFVIRNEGDLDLTGRILSGWELPGLA